MQFHQGFWGTLGLRFECLKSEKPPFILRRTAVQKGI